MNASHKKRVSAYTELSTRLSEVPSSEMIRLLKKSKIRAGWGTNHVLKVGGQKIFAKKIPLTELEFQHAFETRNLFKLPLFYNYGVGSAGFGAFRELIGQIKATNWVLKGDHLGFPLMYHYRILPRTEPSSPPDKVWLKKYAEFWNGSEEVAKFIRARSQSKYEIVLFLEYFPMTLDSWVKKNSTHINKPLKDIFKTLSFLQKNKIIHFDAHKNNIMTDGKNFYLSDFGLCLDQKFSLSKSEQKFFKDNSYHDFCYFIGNIGFLLEHKFWALNKSKKKILFEYFGIDETQSWFDRHEALLMNLDFIERLKIFQVHKNYFEFLRNYREVILESLKFFYQLQSNPKKNAKFDNAKFKKLIGKIRDSKP